MFNMISIIDFEKNSVEKEMNSITKADFNHLAAEIWNGFTQTGFVYIKNHGISESEINHAFAISDAFFNLAIDVKKKYQVNTAKEEKHGYVPINGEMLNSQSRQEFRECFNIISTDGLLPETELPGFTSDIKSLYHKCSILASRILRVLAVALNLKDEEYFNKIQLPMDTDKNFTTLRLINYPSIAIENLEISQDVVRCGEHSDYGTITLLFQDATGGLEVKTRNGEFIQAPIIPGTVLVNAGNILDHMTHGTLIAAKHRVLLNYATNYQRRRSIAFFAHPKHDAVVERLTEPKDSNPVTAFEFVKRYLDSTYVVQTS